MEIVRTALPKSEASEGDLLRKAKAGDQRAFTELYRAHASPIYRFALHMSGNPAIAEEVLQETFLAIIRDAGKFEPERGPLGAYMFGIARNRVRKHLGFAREFDEPSEETPGAEDILRDLTRRETIESVRQSIVALPPLYREAVVLCELQELSYEEAAAIVGCPIGTIRSRLHRARTMLLAKLQALKDQRILQ